MSHQYYKPARSRLQRSELAVPGSSPKMFEKALNSNADPNKVSERARKRGAPQLGSLGSGNHFQKYRQFRTSIWYEAMRLKHCKKILSNDHAYGFILNAIETRRIELDRKSTRLNSSHT